MSQIYSAKLDGKKSKITKIFAQILSNFEPLRKTKARSPGKRVRERPGNENLISGDHMTIFI